MFRVFLLLAIGCLCGCAGESKPTTVEQGEREVPGSVTDEPSGNPDLSDPRIDTSLMPTEPTPQRDNP